jgi:uncharacterized membrane protein YccC
MTSLSTMGQSFNKAALRMAGTLVGAVAALILIGLFPQERWWFMAALSVYIGLCTYMMGGSKRQYFWQVCGFVCVIICMDAGPDPANAFKMTALRAQQTGLGILVYSVVSMLLWPTRSLPGLVAATVAQASAQQQLFMAYFELMQGTGNAKSSQPLKGQVVQGQTQLAQLLDAAVADSYEIKELKQPWALYRSQVFKLTEMLECWRESFAEVQGLDLARVLPGLSAFRSELAVRFSEMGRMLGGENEGQRPKSLELIGDQAELEQLKYHQKVACEILLKHLTNLDQLTLEMVEQVRVLKGFSTATVPAGSVSAARAPFVFDLDRGIAALRIMITLWTSYLALIYVDALPGGGSLVSMATSIGMALANLPFVPVKKLIIPTTGGILFAGVLYLFVMPHLSSFSELGVLIFGAVFLICYLFHAPQQALGKALGMAMFLSIASVSNQQSYSFLVVSTTAAMFAVLFLVLLFSANFPFSPRPERVISRLLRRYFRSCDYLFSSRCPAPDVKASWLDRQTKAFHQHEVATLPAKLNPWAGSLNPEMLGGTTKEEVQGLLASLQALSYRTTGLLKERGRVHIVPNQALISDFQIWSRKVQEAMHQLAGDPASCTRAAFGSQLAAAVHQLEEHIAEAASQIESGLQNQQESIHNYHLLGAYRGFSEALIDYTGSAGLINWTAWREERFY